MLLSQDLSMAPAIDLLVATVGRSNELDRLLTSLEVQTYKNFRILLADQNPSGYLDDMLAHHPGLPIIRTMLPPQGVSVARNVLLELASADIIVFPDDDCWYAPDTLERVCETFAAYPSCGALLGVWTSSPGVYASGVTEGVVSRAGLFQLAGTCVQFYRRDAVIGIRFDPLLGPGTGLPYGCGEDTDYLLYAYARTEVRRYAKIRVFHPSPKEIQPSPQKVASYAAGRMYLLKKHKFSWLFVLFNVLYPLCVAPLDALRYGKAQGAYRFRMFVERLRNWH
ncbi:glycosyltransferase family 2 protein [Desulfovibrio sp. QI0442]